MPIAAKAEALDKGTKAARIEWLRKRIIDLSEVRLERGSAEAEVETATKQTEAAKKELATLGVSVAAELAHIAPAAVLDEIVQEQNRFFVIGGTEASAIALWIVHTHTFAFERSDKAPLFDKTPRLIVWSGYRGQRAHRCGKSVLREFIQKLSRNPTHADSLKGKSLENVLQRKELPDWFSSMFGGHRPPWMDKTTFLFDEAEQYTYTGLLIRMLNSGFDREGKAWTDSGATVSTFYPTALFRRFNPINNSELAPMVDRAILVEMQRRDKHNPEHQRERWRSGNPHVKALANLKLRIETVADSIKDDLSRWYAEDDFLLDVDDRAVDIWEPLIAIADAAGDHWPETARRICRELCAARDWDAAPAYETPSAPEIAKRPEYASRTWANVGMVEEKIIDILKGRPDHKIGWGELGEAPGMSNNVTSASRTQVISNLEGRDEIRIKMEPPGPRGGPPTKMIVLVMPGDAAGVQATPSE